MVVTDDPALAERCRSLRNLCFQPHQRFIHEELGWNYRMTNLQAALGLAQLERLPDALKKKHQLGHFYRSKLSKLTQITFQSLSTSSSDNIFWVFGIVLSIESGFNARQFADLLTAAYIGTRPFFYPIHLQPFFRSQGLFHNVSLPVSEHLALQGLYLPSGLALKGNQIDRVCDTVISLL